MNKTILITGASGFVGKHLVDILSDNYHILECKRTATSHNCNEVIVDLLDEESVKSAIVTLLQRDEKIEYCIHTAAIVAKSDNIKSFSLFDSNMIITNNIIRLCQELAIEKVINFSSMAVYPNKSGHYNENSTINPSFNEDCLYGLAKYSSEELMNYMLLPMCKVVHLRIAQIIGDGMNSSRIIPIMLEELKEKNTITVFGNGKRVSAFIEVASLVRKIAFLLKVFHIGVFNIGDKNISYDELAQGLIIQSGNKFSSINYIKSGSTTKFNLVCNKFDNIYEYEKEHISWNN
jgi:nucleoside-diphosphate-sugar epimerase